MTTPLALWQEKKQYLEYQLAITSDASQMYTLRKQIQECETEIARLQSKATQEQAIMPFRQGAITSSTVAFIIIKEL
ncbi:MAG: hypothetical protein HY819_12465 [Acidobacteria bacterium]|nr:hypothetical protein [Acidobacteriota bacterium]